MPGTVAISRRWPLPRIVERSMTDCNSRTSPGQEHCASSTRSVGVTGSIVSPNRRAAFRAKWFASDGMKLSFVVNDGLNFGTQGGAGTGFQNTGTGFNNDSTDFALTARVDYLFAGKWSDTTDLAAWSDSPFNAVVGRAVHYEVAETGDRQASGTTPQTGPYDSFVEWTIDGLVKADGFSFLGAVYGLHINGTQANAHLDTNSYAAVAQVGYAVVPDKLVPFVRYEYVSVDNELTAQNNLNVVVDYFFKRHSLKFTADVVWALNNINAGNTPGTCLTGIGLLNNSANKENQTVGRVQIQLFF